MPSSNMNKPTGLDAAELETAVQAILGQVRRQLEQEDTVVVQVAEALQTVAREQLESKLLKKFSTARQVRFDLDTTLIAGLRIQYQDYLYDDTVRGRLTQLRSVNTSTSHG